MEQQVMKDIPAAINVIDDIIVGGPTTEIHDQRLKMIMERYLY